MVRKVALLIVICFTSIIAFCQSEALKDVTNNLAFYNKKKDLKCLLDAKKAVDGLFKTHADSINLEKNVYKAIVYANILDADTVNKLNMPDTLLRYTANLTDKLMVNPKAYQYDVEVNYVICCLSNTYLRNGFNSYKKGNFKLAITNFEAAKKYVPTATSIDGYIATMYYKLGDCNNALTHYQPVLRVAKPKVEYIQSTAVIYEMVGDTAKALETIHKGLTMYAHDKSLLYEEANIYDNRQDYFALNKLLDELLYVAPDDGPVLFMAANCYDHLRRFDDAEILYKKCITLNPTDYKSIFNLGLLYIKQSSLQQSKTKTYWANISKATQMLEKAIKINPDSVPCLKALQMLYLQTEGIDVSMEL